MNKIKMILIQADDSENHGTYFNSAPLGIHRIRKWLESEFKEGIEVTCFDPNLYADARETLNGLLEEARFEIVGYSPLHDTLSRDIGHMLDAGDILPHALHIAGGQQAGLSRELLFRHVPNLSLIARGEGEKPLTELLKKVHEYGTDAIGRNPGRYLSHVRGFYIRGGERSFFTGYPEPFTVEEFTRATLAVDFTDVGLELYWDQLKAHYSAEQLDDPILLGKILTIKPYTSNYCPMGCAFCSTTTFHRDGNGRTAKVIAIRKHDLAAYVRNLLLKNPQARKVMFKDDLFFLRGGSRSDLLEDLQALEDVRNEVHALDGRNVTYHGKARVDTWVDPRTLTVDTRLLEATRRAGFTGVSMGLETFDPDELEAYNKKLGSDGAEVNRLALDACRRYGMNVVSYIILSGLYSTVKSLTQNVRWITRSLSDGHVMRINDRLFSLPGTKIDLDLQESGEGITLETDSPVVGHEHIRVRRVVSVFPRDPEAREVMDEFERSLASSRKEWQKRLGVSHWIPEVEGPHKMWLLNRILAGRAHLPAGESERIEEALEAMLLGYSGSHRSVSNEQTSA
ncbi:hypothetical protein B7767_33520 [Streptomyces sp. 13-12-16]|uniref:B12-binding domain-containing radical SAM protein n=1 Tax=Streptomyces sp. 13-12-16 TaxID=1570823 RepID=UPI000A25EA54|nr:radical SAM protein [Streptomyces sp. 13-12-16]OSP39093.1 hypothetical protein B7767_33520 [Streptomyces sp. 13-12-16]